MKQKLFILLAVIGMMVPQVASAFNVDGIEYSISADGAVVVRSNYIGNVEIPSTVTYKGATYSVTSIGDRAFGGCTGLTSVTIPNSVTSIGNEAFEECFGLTSVTIGSGLTSIGEQAFYDCRGLISITVGRGNTHYDSRDNCNAIIETASNTLIAGCKNTSIPNSVTSIGGGAFFGCSGLASVTIPNSVTSIGNEAFKYCSGLTSVTIGNGVTSIGNEAFRDCDGLTSVVIGNGVTSIGDKAFYYSGLTSVTIGSGVTSIGEAAFCGCSKMTSVTIPNSVTSIGNEAFCDCSGLTSVTIPNSVTSIGSGAFKYCGMLEAVWIGSGVKSIGGSALDCDNLRTVICLAEIPPTCEYYEGIFGYYYEFEKSTLYVPNTHNCYYRYASDEEWGKFRSIKEIDVTSVETPMMKGIAQTSLINLNGQYVNHLQSGIIIKQGKKTLSR